MNADSNKHGGNRMKQLESLMAASNSFENQENTYGYSMVSQENGNKTKLEDCQLFKSIDFVNDPDIINTPGIQYNKSFLQRIPSIIPEAHESIISLKNDESGPLNNSQA